MAEAPDLTEQLTRNLWPAFKRRLQAKFPGEEFVRCLYLLRAVRVNERQVHLLGSLPASGRIIAGALRHLPAMRALLAPSFNLSLTVQPNEWQLSEARKRYGIDMSPKAWAKKK